MNYSQKSAALLACVLWGLLPGSSALASGHGAKEEKPKGPVSRIYELGDFELREVQSTRKKTTEIVFSAYFVIGKEVPKERIQELEHWKQRLRDQVIIAVRTAKNMDFQEPDLERLRRIILFRVRRLLKEDVVQDVLISKFTFKTE